MTKRVAKPKGIVFDESLFGISGLTSWQRLAFKCNLLYGGKIIAVASDEGMGGEISFEYKNKDLFDHVKTWVEGLPPIEADEFSLNQTIDLFVGRLVEREARRKELQRAAKKYIIYAKPKAGISEKNWLDSQTFYQLKGQWNKANRDEIIKRNPGGEVFFVNQMFTPLAEPVTYPAQKSFEEIVLGDVIQLDKQLTVTKVTANKLFLVEKGTAYEIPYRGPGGGQFLVINNIQESTPNDTGNIKIGELFISKETGVIYRCNKPERKGYYMIGQNLITGEIKAVTGPVVKLGNVLF